MAKLDHDAAFYIPSLKLNLYYQIDTTNPDQGVYGSYFQISKRRGLKVITSDKVEENPVHLSLEALKKSRIWKNAQSEFDFLKKVESTKLSPKAYKLLIAKDPISDNYYPAILMDHIEGEVFNLTEKSAFKVGSEVLHIDIWAHKRKAHQTNHRMPRVIQEKVLAKLHSCGVHHPDLHDDNVIVQGSNIRVIDFGLARNIKPRTLDNEEDKAQK